MLAAVLAFCCSTGFSEIASRPWITHRARQCGTAWFRHLEHAGKGNALAWLFGDQSYHAGSLYRGINRSIQRILRPFTYFESAWVIIESLYPLTVNNSLARSPWTQEVTVRKTSCFLLPYRCKGCFGITAITCMQCEYYSEHPSTVFWTET